MVETYLYLYSIQYVWMQTSLSYVNKPVVCMHVCVSMYK